MAIHAIPRGEGDSIKKSYIQYTTNVEHQTFPNPQNSEQKNKQLQTQITDRGRENITICW